MTTRNEKKLRKYKKIYDDFNWEREPESNWFIACEEDEVSEESVDFRLPLDHELYKVYRKNVFRKSLFINLTEILFNRIFGNVIKDEQVSDYLSFHYKNIENDKEVFIEYIENIRLSLNQKFSKKKRQIFRDWIRGSKKALNRGKVFREEVFHSFKFQCLGEGLSKKASLNSELDYLRDKMIDNAFIGRETSKPNFRKIFTGVQIKPQKPVRWIGTVAELKYFVNIIYEQFEPCDKWKTTAKCFIKKDRSNFVSRNIDRAKEIELRLLRKSSLDSFVKDIIKVGGIPMKQNPVIGLKD